MSAESEGFMNDREKPVDFHPDLTLDRLDLVASLIGFVHNDALVDMKPKKGDNCWLLGGAGFVRSCAAIQHLAREKRFPWLTISDPSMHFVFRVGSVQVRVCKGDEEGSPNGNSMTRVGEEVALYGVIYLDGFFDPDYADCVWRFVIVKRRDGRVDRVEFQLVRAPKGETVRSWAMPLKADISGLLEWDKSASYTELPAADVPDITFGQRPKKDVEGESAG